LGSALATARAAVQTVDANLAWFDKYRGDISAWMTQYTEPATTTTTTTTTQAPSVTEPSSTTTTEGASSLSFNPIMGIIIMMGYIAAKY
jgi:hypothetical protein